MEKGGSGDDMEKGVWLSSRKELMLESEFLITGLIWPFCFSIYCCLTRAHLRLCDAELPSPSHSNDCSYRHTHVLEIRGQAAVGRCTGAEAIRLTDGPPTEIEK